MSLAFDEFGRPYIILREQDKKSRIKGIEAIKINLESAKAIGLVLKTSLGPKGMDKMIVSPDGEVLITNDGATIVEKMEIMHPIAHLMVELSQSQDNEIGDGTTGVVVLAAMLMEQAITLLEKGIHPLKIASGFEKAADLVTDHLDSVAEERKLSRDEYVKVATTSLGSKVVSQHKQKLAQIAVDAILCVADLERKDVNFDLIKIVGKPGGSLVDTELIKGVLIDKELSHPQMDKKISNAKIAIVTCPFEPPKPKTKYNLNITSADDYKNLAALEQAYFVDMVKKVKESGADLVLCQWGFDDEANHLLLQNGLRAVRWVNGQDIELLALATGARIIPRFEELHPQKLGFAGIVEEISFGTTANNMLVVKDLSHMKAVSILLRGGSKTIIDEAHRSMHDALCVIRNLVREPRVIVGGGAAELSASIFIKAKADENPTVEQYAMRAFGDALEQICVILAENSGLDPIQSLSEARSRQIEEKSHRYGIACLEGRVDDMRRLEVFETLASKKHQIQIATQLVKMILKIDDLIEKVVF
jgi:T-complex protein 1 subunit epsilon